MCKIQEIHIFTWDSHSTKYVYTQGISLHSATVYLCSLKELYLFTFKEMIYLLTVKEILKIHSENIYLFTKCIVIRGNYIRSRNYIHFKELTSSFNELIFIQGNIFIQGKCIHSGKLYPFKE